MQKNYSQTYDLKSTTFNILVHIPPVSFFFSYAYIYIYSLYIILQFFFVTFFIT